MTSLNDQLGADEVIPKIFVRTLLYATGNRGHVVQSMFLRVQCAEATQNFSTWGHGPQNDLKFGAGLKVGPDGIDHHHHFNPPKNAEFHYMTGDYVVDIFAEIADSDKRLSLGRTSLTVTAEQAELLKNPQAALYFEWGPDSQTYNSHIHMRQADSVGIPNFLKSLAPKVAQSKSDETTN